MTQMERGEGSDVNSVGKAHSQQLPPIAPIAPGTTKARQDIPADLLAEFEAAARRPLRARLRYAFIHTYKPVLDDARFRSFATTAEYREWCENNLPEWLGYGRI